MPSVVDQVVNDVSKGLFNARMLTLLRSTFPQTAMDLILQNELTNGFQSVFYPPSSATVGVYYGGDNNRKIMYLDGITTNQQAVNLVNGYASILGLRAILGPQAWIAENLPTYLAMMTGNHLQQPTYLDLVGYSAGGAVAQSLAYELRRRNTTMRIQVFTYGSPRPGGPLLRDSSTRMPTVRYMNAADPIPLVPPRFQDAPALVSVLPVSVGLSWSNMVHTQGGQVLYDNGTTAEDVLPPEAAMSPGTSLASWYFSLDGGLQGPHAMSSYVNSLLAVNERKPLPREQKLDLAGGEDDDQDNRREVNRQRDRVAQKISLSQREQNAQIVNQPIFVLFKPVRQGRIWTVVFGDKVVCQGVREDTCRHLCRAGNDFLRSLPKQGLVDPIALRDQFEQFFLFATAPQSEWIPKLRTNLDLS